MSASVTSFVYIRVLCFDVRSENNQIASSLFGTAFFTFWRLLFIFVAAIFSTRDIFDVDMPTIVLKFV